MTRFRANQPDGRYFASYCEIPTRPVTWRFMARPVVRGTHAGKVGWSLTRCDYAKPTRSSCSTDTSPRGGSGYAESLDEALTLAAAKCPGPLAEAT